MCLSLSETIISLICLEQRNRKSYIVRIKHVDLLSEHMLRQNLVCFTLFLWVSVFRLALCSHKHSCLCVYSCLMNSMLWDARHNHLRLWINVALWANLNNAAESWVLPPNACLPAKMAQVFSASPYDPPVLERFETNTNFHFFSQEPSWQVNRCLLTEGKSLPPGPKQTGGVNRS